MFGRLETEQIFPHCEYVGPCREESEHNKRELMEFAAAENAHGHYKESKAARRFVSAATFGGRDMTESLL